MRFLALLVLVSCHHRTTPVASQKELVLDWTIRGATAWKKACHPHDLDLTGKMVASINIWQADPAMSFTAFQDGNQTHFVSCRLLDNCPPGTVECIDYTRCCDHTALTMIKVP